MLPLFRSLEDIRTEILRSVVFWVGLKIWAFRRCVERRILISVIVKISCAVTCRFFSIGLTACHLCFHQKASEQLQVGVELEINNRLQESTGTIGYQVDLPKADLVFRGIMLVLNGTLITYPEIQR